MYSTFNALLLHLFELKTHHSIILERDIMTQTKNWCFTIFTECFPLGNIDETQAEFLVYQLEETEECQRHIQGYIELKQRCRLQTVKRILGDNRAHVEPRKGTRYEAFEYCSKFETRVCDEPYIIGTPPSKDPDTDETPMDRKIQKVWEFLDTHPGVDKRTIAKTFPHIWCRFSKVITDYMEEQLREISNDVPMHHNPFITVYYGPTGTGKSTRVWEETNHMKDCYKLICDGKADSTLWLDGYDGWKHKILVIEDFDGESWNITTMLHLLQNQPQSRYQKKGGHHWVTGWEKVYITSNIAPVNWYQKASPNHKAALLGRIARHGTIVLMDRPVIIPPLPVDLSEIDDSRDIDL